MRGISASLIYRLRIGHSLPLISMAVNYPYYHVFINHRGPDTKDSFAVPLYRSLTSRGLRVFLDKSELEAGNKIISQIEAAIEVASVNIAIFSPRYAESPWCLNELLSMLKSGNFIIPVFYNIEPKDLQWRATNNEGQYAKALREHEEKQRHSMGTIQQWRRALSFVANISGLELEAFNGDIFELLDKAVQGVLRHIPKTPLAVSDKHPFNVAEYPPSTQYDVFINPTGPDTKDTFAAPLYRSLTSRGLRVFLQKPELQLGHHIGSQIINAIHVACVHIAVFSPSYAESQWSLEELLLMMNSGKTIIPVFYNVNPRDLRWTRGDKGAYVHALRNHEEKSGCVAVDGWRNVLSKVADISGFELEAFNGDKFELLDKVVERVLTRLPKTPLAVSEKYPFNEAKYPPGLGQKLQELENKVLSLQQQKAKVVGIVGVGGVGKTTLTKAYFNLKSSHYTGSSFLFDVRENAQKMSLNNLQRKLIKDLKHIEIEFQSHEESIGILRQYISGCHALIVLDDVDDIDQIDAFMPIKDVLHPMSLILVTSRDKNAIRIPESAIYTLEGLTKEQSKELFSSHAFPESTHESPAFENLVNEILSVSDGLPLSLRVLGALLSGKSKSYWEEQLEEFHRLLPRKIEDRLKISYNSLNRGEKEIFLDIACFFKGEDRDRAIRIWGLVGIQNLENKCILGVDIDNKIKMHDHFRDLGRNIAKEDSMPRRLWCPTREDIDELLEQSSSVPTNVRGITMVPSLNFRDAFLSSYDTNVGSFLCSEMSWWKRWSDEVFGNWKWKLLNDDRLRGICNLQLLATEDGYLEGIFRKVSSPHLIWLRWYKCPYSSLPLWISMKNLRVLEVAGSRLNILWGHESQAPPELRELNVWAPLSEFPKSIEQLKHLEKIVVDCIPPATPTLETLPEEFCRLRSLKHLELRRCSRMMLLPDSFGNLTNLEHIDLSYSSLLNLPDSFMKLKKLKHLSLTWCGNFTIRQIGGLCDLTELQHIDISGCAQVENLPNLETLVSLEVIKAASCNNLNGIEGLAQLTKIRHLDISWCSEVEELPGVEHCMSLKKLELVGCPKLRWGEEVLEQLRQRLKDGLQI